MKKLSKVVIVGGGVSGLFAGIYASSSKNEVIILEKMEKLGKKILVTGNGRCNFWNEDISFSHYNSECKELLKDIITLENKNKVLSFFDSVNLVPYIKNGYYYPYSKEASTVREILLREVSNRNVKIVNDCKVQTIVKKNDKFIINDKIVCDKVIIATGSLAYYKDKDLKTGYDIAKSFGHKIEKLLPSLVQLVVKNDDNLLKMWINVRCEAIVSLICNNEKLKEEKGELMLTDYGLSGICIFNLSTIATRLLSDRKKVFVSINFAPWCDDFLGYFTSSIKKFDSFSIYTFLQGILHSKIIDIVLERTKINKDRKLGSLSNIEVKEIVNCITSLKVEIKCTKSFEFSQTTAGGVSLSEINLKNMESKLVKNLFFAGEVVDVDGECGGFNLAFAFISGLLAGSGCLSD